MRKSMRWTLGGLAVLVIVGVPVLKVYPGPSDAARIDAALEASLKASREGRPGGVLEFLTDKFEINDQVVGTRREIGVAIRNSKPEVEVTNRDSEVFGDDAKIVSPVRVKVAFMGQPIDQRIEGVTILFKREPARAFFVLPTHTWRIDKVYLPEGVPLPWSMGN